MSTPPESPKRPWLGVAAAIAVAFTVLAVSTYGAQRRASQDPPTPQTWQGIVLTSGDGSSVTLTKARVECRVAANDTQGVLAVLSGTVDGVDVQVVLGTAAYANERTVSFPHIRDAGDPSFAKMTAFTATQEFASDQGGAAGSITLSTSCANKPFVEIVADGRLGEVAGGDTLQISGSLRAEVAG